MLHPLGSARSSSSSRSTASLRSNRFSRSNVQGKIRRGNFHVSGILEVEIERAIMPSALCPLSVRTNFDPAFHGSSDPVEHN
jgi:hypothetical protein